MFVGKVVSHIEGRTLGRYQSEGTQHRQSLYVWEAQLHQAETDNDAVKDIPSLLKVVVRVQGDDLKNHLWCEDPREHLMNAKHTLSLNSLQIEQLN